MSSDTTFLLLAFRTQEMNDPGCGSEAHTRSWHQNHWGALKKTFTCSGATDSVGMVGERVVGVEWTGIYISNKLHWAFWLTTSIKNYCLKLRAEVPTSGSMDGRKCGKSSMCTWVFLWGDMSQSPEVVHKSAFLKKFLFLYCWPCWVFVAVLVLLSGCGAKASCCGGFSCRGAWALGGPGSVLVAHGLSYSKAWGIFPDQGSNPCPLHW